MKRFTIAGIQIGLAEPNNIEKNERKAIEWLHRTLKEKEVDLVVYPETCNTGFDTRLPNEELWNLVDSIPGRTTAKIQKVAEDYGIYVVWNTYERSKYKDRVYNSSVLIGRDGGIVGIYRKTHPFITERFEEGGWTIAGNNAEVFTTDIAKIGLMICYDGDFPELSRTYALKGAEVIIRSSAFLRTYDQWYAENFARAYENHVYLIAINAVGQDAAKNCYFGHSQIFAPNGWRLAQARCAEEIITAELSSEPIEYIYQGGSSRQTFDHVADRNLDAYDIMKKGVSSLGPLRRKPDDKT
ncbi:MAG: carbon-nitrogen hydrolase family protein [Candidatus Methanomethyliaceae archaeon]